MPRPPTARRSAADRLATLARKLGRLLGLSPETAAAIRQMAPVLAPVRVPIRPPARRVRRGSR